LQQTPEEQQVPLQQTWGKEQALPQTPQLSGSVCRLTQVPLQQVPFWPGRQASPQAPQLLTSLVRSTQAPLQQL
jgi:hypothetical protein